MRKTPNDVPLFFGVVRCLQNNHFLVGQWGVRLWWMWIWISRECIWRPSKEICKFVTVPAPSTGLITLARFEFENHFTPLSAQTCLHLYSIEIALLFLHYQITIVSSRHGCCDWWTWDECVATPVLSLSNLQYGNGSSVVDINIC